MCSLPSDDPPQPPRRPRQQRLVQDGVAGDEVEGAADGDEASRDPKKKKRRRRKGESRADAFTHVERNLAEVRQAFGSLGTGVVLAVKESPP